MVRHQKSKGSYCKPNGKQELSKEQFKQNILQLIENAKCNEYECYPVVIKEAITSYDNPPSETFFNILQDIVEAFRKNRNGNTFLASYYSQIVLNAQLYFIGLPTPTCTLFSKTLGDRILSSVTNEGKEENPLPPKAISEREMVGLQYLAGYVVRKSLMAAKKIKDPKEREAATLILQNSITSDADQRLIHATNRGGLTAIKNEWVQVFVIVEEVFRANAPLASKRIDVENIKNIVLRHPRAISLYESLIQSSTTEELKHKILKNIIMLYIRVRSFSLAKDVVNKHKKKRN